jgi:hypothetical protein
MYTHAIDETHAVLLGVYSGAREAGDVDRCVESMQRTDRIALGQKRGALFVVVPDPQYPSPNSQDRQRFAALNGELSCRAEPVRLGHSVGSATRGDHGGVVAEPQRRAVVCGGLRVVLRSHGAR